MTSHKTATLTVPQLQDLAIVIQSLITATPKAGNERLIAQAGSTLAGINALLKQAAGPQSFSGNELGCSSADPTRSPYL